MGLFGFGSKKDNKNNKKSKEGKSSKHSSKKEEDKLDIEDKISEGKILVRAIIEVLGIPKEHVIESIHSYVDNISNDSKFKLLKRDFSDVKEFGDKKHGKLFSIFAEIEFLAKNKAALMDFCFEYMPSSLEIIEPERMMLSANDLNALFNDMQARLHEMDKIVKSLRIENSNIEINAAALLRNLIMNGIAEKSKTLKEISDYVGISEEQLKPFIAQRIKEGFIDEKDGLYSLKRKKAAKGK